MDDRDGWREWLKEIYASNTTDDDDMEANIRILYE